MSSSSPAWRVELRPGPSRFLLGFFAVLHAAAALAVLAANVLPFLKAVLLVAVLVLLLLAWRQERAANTLWIAERDEDWWVRAGSRRGRARLAGRRVWRYLVVMDFRCEGGGRRWRQRVVILPDAVPADTFRRLRIRLRHGHRLDPGGASAQ